MDQNIPPPPPSTTAPSEQGEHISNLSTRPNMNEQNDSYDGRLINHSHHSQSIYFGRENSHVQQKSEKQSSNHSQNYNKAHSQPLIDNSDFPNLNQNVSQLLPQQDSKSIKIQPERVYQFKIVDQHWQAKFKQQQAQNYVLFQQNNEMLLTQKQEDDFGFTESFSCQQEMVVEQDKRSDISNQVKINQFVSKFPNIIQQLDSHSSHSVKQQPIFPLFQNTVKDQSQSNLLDFGFSKQSNRAPHLTWTGRQQHTIIEPANSQNSNSIQMINNDSSLQSYNENNNRVPSIQNFSTISQIGYKEPEQPMIIQQTVQNSQSKHSSKFQSLHSPKHQQKDVSNHSSEHSSKHSSKNINQIIKIEVHNCKQELIDSHTKNNDIYGIIPKEQANIVEKEQQPIEHSWQENMPQNTAHQEINLDKQTNNQSQQIIFKEEQKQNFPLSQTFIHPQQYVKQQRQQPLPQQTVEEIIQKLQNIIQSKIPQEEKAQEGGKILQKHIDFLFLSPRTDIGKQILSDGKYCILLIDIILMKETDNITKNILQKYLHLTFASKIRKGQNKFIQYQHSSVSISNDQPEYHQKQIPKQSQSHANYTTHDTLHDTFNESVYAEHGSSGKNQSEKMIVQSINQPMKRTVVTREPAALKSQKPTRKTRLKTKGKGKGKTTAKKSAVKFEENLNQSQVKQEVNTYSQVERKSERNSFRKNRQSQTILNDSFNKTNQRQYGSKFTFILRDNLKSEQKELVQVRKSRRLANKHNDSEGKQIVSSRRTRNSQKSPQLSSSKKKPRLSGSKKYLQQQIDINFIKENMKVLVIKNGTTLQQFQALTPMDEEIINIINDYEKTIISTQRSNRLQSQEQVQQQSHESTNSINYSNNASNTNAESLSISRLQFKKKLSKYRIPKVLIINRVIDPNINNHGIYALLELNPLSQIVHGVKYVLTPITNLSRASKKLIDEDLLRAKAIVNDEFDNFAFIQPSDSILKEIKKEDEKRLKNK